MEMLLLLVILVGLGTIAGLLQRLQKFEELARICYDADLRHHKDVLLVRRAAEAIKEMR